MKFQIFCLRDSIILESQNWLLGTETIHGYEEEIMDWYDDDMVEWEDDEMMGKMEFILSHVFWILASGIWYRHIGAATEPLILEYTVW